MPDTFVCYSRADEAFAQRLSRHLQEVDLDVWIDVENIEGGNKWSSEIQDGLDKAKVMLLILSPTSAESINVEDEWQYFRDLEKPIVPILWKPTSVHYQLRRIQYVNFHENDFETAFGQLTRILAARGLKPKTSALSEAATVTAPELPEQKPLPATEPPFGRQRNRLIAGLLFVLLMGIFVGIVNYDYHLERRGTMLVNPFEIPPFAQSELEFFEEYPLVDLFQGEMPAFFQDCVVCIRRMGIFDPASSAETLYLQLTTPMLILGVLVSIYLVVTERANLRAKRDLRSWRFVLSEASQLLFYGVIAINVYLLAVSQGIIMPDSGLIMSGLIEIGITLLLTYFVGVGLGFVISTVVARIETVTYITIVVVLVQVGLSGLVNAFPQQLARNEDLVAISRLSILRWASEALGGTSDIRSRAEEVRIIFERPALNRKGEIMEGISSKMYYPAPTELKITTFAISSTELIARWMVMAGVALLGLLISGVALSRYLRPYRAQS